MPILYVSPQERALIPLDLQAEYELGRISKKQLDDYLHGTLKKVADAPETKDYRDSLKLEYGQPKAEPEKPVDASGNIEGIIPKYVKASDDVTGLNREFVEARAEDNRFAYLDRLVNEPGFYENELSKVEA